MHTFTYIHLYIWNACEVGCALHYCSDSDSDEHEHRIELGKNPHKNATQMEYIIKFISIFSRFHLISIQFQLTIENTKLILLL